MQHSPFHAPLQFSTQPGDLTFTIHQGSKWVILDVFRPRCSNHQRGRVRQRLLEWLRISHVMGKEVGKLWDTHSLTIYIYSFLKHRLDIGFEAYRIGEKLHIYPCFSGSVATCHTRRSWGTVLLNPSMDVDRNGECFPSGSWKDTVWRRAVMFVPFYFTIHAMYRGGIALFRFPAGRVICVTEMRSQLCR
jgi:hypothetical protein